MEGEQETSSSKWVLKFCGEIWYATCTSTSENEANNEKSDYEKQIKENKRSLQEEVERAMNKAELELCLLWSWSCM